jgi:hypothetical protein
MNDHNNLTTLVPQGVIKRIKAHFDESIDEAVKRHRFNKAKEDGLTGGLVQAMAMPEHLVSVVKGSQFSFAVEVYTILGNGPGTPEKRTGADGIFQIIVRHDGKEIFSKGLPFQSKRDDQYSKKSVESQAQTMFETSGSGIVLRFSDKEYDAEDVRHEMNDDDEQELPTEPGFHPLGTVLGDWFLQCQIGVLGLTFDANEPDPNKDNDPKKENKRGFWVVSTVITETDIS